MKRTMPLSTLGTLILIFFVFQPVYAKNAAAQERLYEASFKCDIKEIKKAIADGADVNLIDKTNCTPLLLAVTESNGEPVISMKTRIKAIETLIKNGAEITMVVLISALYNFTEADTSAELLDYAKLAKMLIENTPGRFVEKFL